MYQTDDLTTTAFLTCQGHPPDRAYRHGSIVIFDFDCLSDGQAFQLLNSSAFRLAKSYHIALRSIRRMMDSAPGNGRGTR